MEHEIVADADPRLRRGRTRSPIEPPSGPHTEERQTIAEQPTEIFDVEAGAWAEPPSPTDEELVEEEIAEPRLAPTDPLAGLAETEEAEVSVQGPAPDDDDEYDDEDDDFWNEQRLSDELDQALEAPRDAEPEPAAEVETRRSPSQRSTSRPSPTRPSPRNTTSRRRRRRAGSRRRIRAGVRAPRGGRARGDAGLPRGDPRGRPALVRAEAAQGLRLRRLSRRGRSPRRAAYTSRCGAIAQLAERRVCNAEVAGSIPAGSTLRRASGSAAPARPPALSDEGRALDDVVAFAREMARRELLAAS